MAKNKTHYKMVVKIVKNGIRIKEKIEVSSMSLPISDDEAVEIAKIIIANFNETLHAGESTRKLIRVERVDTKITKIKI